MKIRSKITFKTRLKKGLLLPALLCSLGLSAQMRNLEVELPGGEMTYGEVFERIETQHEVWFGYAIQDINPRQTIVLPKGTVSLGFLLDLLFDGTMYRYSFSGKHILVTRGDGLDPADGTESYARRTLFYRSYEPPVPKIVLKSNLLYDMTTTLNLGAEFRLSEKWTLDIPFNYNPWEFNDETRFRHWGVQPEARYWFCESFSGWFVGGHLHYAKFNVGGWPDWPVFSGNMQKNRYQGHLYGLGFSAGYSWIVKKRWSMEATLGLGYARIDREKFPCATCGTGVDKGVKHYFGPTRVGLSLIYVIK